MIVSISILIKWDCIFNDIDVEYIADLPNYPKFWNSIERNSLCVIDDLWTSASSNENVSNAFKVYSKKYGFSIVIVTQVNIGISHFHAFFEYDQFYAIKEFFRIFSNLVNIHKIFVKILK